MSSLTIPNSVTSIGDWAFANCVGLTSVTIPNSVTHIGHSAFFYCSRLTNVTIGTNVTSIGDSAFVVCISLTSIAIPNSVTSIGFEAFNRCSGLTNVTIGNSVTNIGDIAFGECTSLTAITVDQTIAAYSSAAGVLFDKSQTTLIQYPLGKGRSYTIPASVTNIGDRAFFYCTSLTGVYFQGNAPSVGVYVFDGDDSATVYYLPGTAGWGSTFGGRPAVLWNPLIQARGASFGVRTNQFGFSVTGTTNIPIVVEACTNLASAMWTSLQTCTLTNGFIYFSDPAWTDSPRRFYRLRSP